MYLHILARWNILIFCFYTFFQVSENEPNKRQDSKYQLCKYLLLHLIMPNHQLPFNCIENMTFHILKDEHHVLNTLVYIQKHDIWLNYPLLNFFLLLLECKLSCIVKNALLQLYLGGSTETNCVNVNWRHNIIFHNGEHNL